MKRLFVYLVFLIILASTSSFAQEYPVEVQKYLKPGNYINSDHPDIIVKVKELVGDEKDVVKKAKILFEFVRDEIHEKVDIDSYVASDILAKRIGVCYHKAILLAALARAAGIPARLHFDEVFIKGFKDKNGILWNTNGLHGITGLYLNGKWLTYDGIGTLERWKIWMGDDPVTIKLPLEFSAEHDVLFPSVGRVALKKTPQKLFDHDMNEKKRICKLYGIEY